MPIIFISLFITAESDRTQSPSHLVPLIPAILPSHLRSKTYISIKGIMVFYASLLKTYPWQRNPHLFKPHTDWSIQKWPLRYCFCRRCMRYNPRLRLLKEMICHGCTKDPTNLRFISSALFSYLSKGNSFTDRKTGRKSKSIDCL